MSWDRDVDGPPSQPVAVDSWDRDVIPEHDRLTAYSSCRPSSVSSGSLCSGPWRMWLHKRIVIRLGRLPKQTCGLPFDSPTKKLSLLIRRSSCQRRTSPHWQPLNLRHRERRQGRGRGTGLARRGMARFAISGAIWGASFRLSSACPLGLNPFGGPWSSSGSQLVICPDRGPGRRRLGDFISCCSLWTPRFARRRDVQRRMKSIPSCYSGRRTDICGLVGSGRSHIGT